MRAHPPRVGLARMLHRRLGCHATRPPKDEIRLLMTYATERFPAPVRRAGRRALVVFAVLVGLFLMHGISASADTACSVPVASMAASATGGSVVAQAAVDHRVSPRVAHSSVPARDCALDPSLV